jgi:hypothetical protein
MILFADQCIIGGKSILKSTLWHGARHVFIQRWILENALHEEAVKNPIEPERQEKIIKDLRAVVHRLKPFIEEIKPLLKGEKPNSP